MIQVNIIKYSKIKWCYYFSDKISKKWLFFFERGWQVGFWIWKIAEFYIFVFQIYKENTENFKFILQVLLEICLIWDMFDAFLQAEWNFYPEAKLFFDPCNCYFFSILGGNTTFPSGFVRRVHIKIFQNDRVKTKYCTFYVVKGWRNWKFDFMHARIQSWDGFECQRL